MLRLPTAFLHFLKFPINKLFLPLFIELGGLFRLLDRQRDLELLSSGRTNELSVTVRGMVHMMAHTQAERWTVLLSSSCRRYHLPATTFSAA